MKNNLATGSPQTSAREADSSDQSALAALCVVVLPVWMRHLQTSQDKSEIAVKQMLHSFGNIEAQLQLRSEKPGLPIESVQESVESMYIALQYQDRYGQMLQLLHNDMGRLLAALQNPETLVRDFDGVAWLTHLESKYAMTEQHRDHSDQSIDQDASDNGTSFF